ncbi:MAG TPA: methyltransferase domain-containing protein [Solirubrobacterales bacterium]|nr:methyltransferase domain-containing protein [Solirubrobacterales bacterium]
MAAPAPDDSTAPAAAPPGQQDATPDYLAARTIFAESFLLGEGLEIGPLHQPLTIPRGAGVRYVDRMRTPDLRREYPELADWDLTEVDVVDDGEKLATIPAESQDFIIANHFLEHTEDPIGTIITHLSKLRPGGILFYAVPDKRYTFDFQRALTPLEHMVADHEQGPERSRREHYEEWAQFVIGAEGPDATELEAMAYSIHMHVWSQAEFLRLILAIRERTGDAFDIEACAHRGIEFMVVLRKRGAVPPPGPDSQGVVRARPTPDPSRRRRVRRAIGAAKRELLGPGK